MHVLISPESSGDNSVGCLLQANKCLTCCGEAIDGTALIIAGRECIVVFCSVSVLRPILEVGAPSVLCCCRGA